ncbi:DUF11 domain-containing protein [Calothrix rhizosoleniae]|uniref:DUF11 domain-containing protein n=1 Tax=Calothrix rhizosoleniae TaxID=888997 RepID=UPI000B4A4A50|nr:DUF11 domain-containing protein [Calothrix rhizosoleniae]
MKRFSIAGLSAVALVASVAFATQIPVVANFLPGGSAIAQNAKKGVVKLRLDAAKKVVVQDAQGKQKVNWKVLAGQATVQPGDVLRYTITGSNNGEKAVKGLVINQPIPQGMKYVLKSATVNDVKGAKITYSIDKGKSFVENPTIKVKQKDGTFKTVPAPAELYSNIRWKFGDSVAAKGAVKGTYQLQVR